MHTNPYENLLTPRDAGLRLKLTTSGVQRLARLGALPEIRDSAGRRLFRLEDVDALIEKRERKAAKAAAASAA